MYIDENCVKIILVFDANKKLLNFTKKLAWRQRRKGDRGMFDKLAYVAISAVCRSVPFLTIITVF